MCCTSGQQSQRWFSVDSGVRQGCIISPILFLVAIDWVMRKTTIDQNRGIQWTMFSTLEDLDFADDIALLSSKHSHIQEKTTRLSHFANQVGLHINTKKTQEMQLNTKQNHRITIYQIDIKQVKNFTYLGSVISTEDATTKDIKSRLAKARFAFHKLGPIWKSNQYSLKTKLKIFNSNVKSVLMYGSECWRVTKVDMKSISTFQNNCLRRICKIFWPQTISNQDLYNLTHSKCITAELKQRRLRWLGHVLRMPASNNTKIALHWTPQGKRPRGRPKTTCDVPWSRN